MAVMLRCLDGSSPPLGRQVIGTSRGALFASWVARRPKLFVREALSEIF
jgi:hypothetical protein